MELKQKNNLESNKEIKRPGRKKSEESSVKSKGLFDHIKHIRTIQDPEYYKNLNDVDKKSFNHFMILRALSMNPELLEDVSFLFRFFDKIPSPQFYQLLIGGVIPPSNKYYPWIKGKKSQFSKTLIELISTYFEISKKEAREYAYILSNSKGGQKELENICRGYGLNDKEVENALKGDNLDEE